MEKSNFNENCFHWFSYCVKNYLNQINISFVFLKNKTANVFQAKYNLRSFSTFYNVILCNKYDEFVMYRICKVP